MGRIIVHDTQRAFDDSVTLGFPPFRPTGIVLREPGLEHSGEQQIEQTVQYGGLARLDQDAVTP